MEYKYTESGIKAEQRTDGEDRELPFRTMRRQLTRGGSICINADGMEWLNEYEEWYPLLLWEITHRKRIDNGKTYPDEFPPESYFESILSARYNIGCAQGDITRRHAKLLGCQAWLIVTNDTDANVLYMYNLLEMNGNWITVNPKQIEVYLLRLANVKRDALKITR